MSRSSGVRGWPVLVVLLGACAGPPKIPPAPPPGPVPEGPVAPRFGWFEGLSAQVTHSSSTLRSGEDAESGSSRYRMRVKDEGGALRVVFEGLQLEASGAGVPQVAIPSVVVGRDGRFRRIEDEEEALAVVAKRLEEDLEDAALRERALGMLRAAMRENARELWHLQVEGWLGLTLSPGVPVTREGRLAPSVLDNVEVPVTQTLVYEGPAPCAEKETETRCVRLRLAARLSEGALPRVEAAFLQRLAALQGGAALGVDVEALEVEQRVELITEPATLVPRFLRTTQRVRLVFTHTGGDTRRTEFEQRDEVESLYEYPGR